MKRERRGQIGGIKNKELGEKADVEEREEAARDSLYQKHKCQIALLQQSSER